MLLVLLMSSIVALLPLNSFAFTTKSSFKYSIISSYIDLKESSIYRSYTTKLRIKIPSSSPILTKDTYSLITNEIKLILEPFNQPTNFLFRAGLIGIFTGLGVVLLKTLIFDTQGILYETLADILPKPAFYWPIALYPFIGSIFVTCLAYYYGPSIWNGLDYIAKSIDSQVKYTDDENRIIQQNSFTNDNSNNLFVDLNTINENVTDTSYLPMPSMTNRRYAVQSKLNPKRFLFTNFLNELQLSLFPSMNNENMNNETTTTLSTALNLLGSNNSLAYTNTTDTSITGNSNTGTITATSSSPTSITNTDVAARTDTYTPLSFSIMTSVSEVALSIKVFLNKISGNKLFVNITAIDTNLLRAAPEIFDPLSLFFRLSGAVTTLGSGCSLGPEGPSVEIGAGISRIFAEMDFNNLTFFNQQPNNNDKQMIANSNSNSGTTNSNSNSNITSIREKHHLFLAGTAAGVAAGFGAPIAGVFFALECGNRCLARNTIKLEEDASDAPRADIAAIVLAATLSSIVARLFLQQKETLFIQGNTYAMTSPFFELPVYFGLAIISGLIAVIFDNLKLVFKSFYKKLSIEKIYRPIVAGAVCGIVAIIYPQTLFNGYATLGELLSNKYLAVTMSSSSSQALSQFFLLVQLLFLKLVRQCYYYYCFLQFI